VSFSSIRTSQEEDVRVVDIFVTTHRLILAEGRHITTNSGGHAKTGVAFDIVGLETRAEELVRRVGLLGISLSGAVERHRIGTVLFDGSLELLDDQVESIVPGSFFKLALLVANQRLGQTALVIENLRQQETLQTEETSVVVLLITFDRNQLAIHRAFVDTTTGSAVATNALGPLDTALGGLFGQRHRRLA